MTDVVFFLPAINPYWRSRFNALAATGTVSFHCVFNEYIDPHRSWTVDPHSLAFPHTFLTTSPRSLGRASELIRLWRRLRPQRIFTFHHVPALWPVWVHRALGGHVALYALMTWDSWVERNWRKEVLKRLFFSVASSTLTPGPDSDDYLRRYGARISHRLHHAVDWSGLKEASDRRTESDHLRLLYIGRLIPEKGVPFLLRVLNEVLRREERVVVEFVGDGELWDAVELWAQQHGSRVRMTPFVQANEVSEVYARSDVLLFPTLGDPYGLVVDEALATGMPVISSDRAGDIQWRIGESRGHVLGPEDEQGWVREVLRLVNDPELLRSRSLDAISFSKGHGTERWVEEVKRWISRTSSSVRRFR